MLPVMGLAVLKVVPLKGVEVLKSWENVISVGEAGPRGTLLKPPPVPCDVSKIGDGPRGIPSGGEDDVDIKLEEKAGFPLKL